MRIQSCYVASLALVLAGASCARSPSSSDPQASTPAAAATPAAALTPSHATTSIVEGRAEIGKPAPDFELSDLDGKKIRLSSYRGKPVVLEWFNPGCPFVKASHTKGSLKGLAEK